MQDVHGGPRETYFNDALRGSVTKIWLKTLYKDSASVAYDWGNPAEYPNLYSFGDQFSIVSYEQWNP